MNKEAMIKIHNQLLNVYLKYLYLAFERVGSDDFGILYDFMDNNESPKESSELFGIQSFLKKEEAKRYAKFQEDLLERLKSRLDKSVEYLAIKEYLSHLALFESSPKSLEMMTVLIIYHREREMSYHDKEVDRKDLEDMKLTIKNDEIIIESKD
jgi:hypothetical protein